MVIVQEIEMASSQRNPAIKWEASNLEEDWKNFEEHAKLMFMGPLKKKQVLKSNLLTCASGQGKPGEEFSNLGT